MLPHPRCQINRCAIIRTCTCMHTFLKWQIMLLSNAWLFVAMHVHTTEHTEQNATRLPPSRGNNKQPAQWWKSLARLSQIYGQHLDAVADITVWYWTMKAVSGTARYFKLSAIACEVVYCFFVLVVVVFFLFTRWMLRWDRSMWPQDDWVSPLQIDME